MAKIKHNNFVKTVDEVITAAKDKGVVHLYAQGPTTDRRYLTINDQKTLHFGTCGYLGLEHHPSVKESAIRAIEQFGTQFSMSKTYISNPLYSELEMLVEEMFQAPVVISKNCTISHLATIPIIVSEEDAVILDHQVHSSIHEAVQKMLTRGVTVEMIRHNNLEMLEEKINMLKGKHQKIWYMSDGVYSMYGDFAPIRDLINLAEKYDQLHLYVDDAHGMSWAGKNGTGYVMSQMPEGLYHKMVLTATLGKGFGACGGVSVFPNHELRRKVKTFGGPNTFSVQLEPPILGAAVASARIHLSDEITHLQNDLQERISYCNSLISKTNLPLVAQTNSPVFFIGAGVMGMTNEFVGRLIDSGVYVNPALFPAVPMKNNGARFTISLNNTLEDIEVLVDSMERNFAASLRATDQSHEKIRKAFKMEPLHDQKSELDEILSQSSIAHNTEKEELSLTIFRSIKEVEKDLWNEKLGHRGMFDWDGMYFLERSFHGNDKPEDNWDFKYFVVRDSQGNPVLVTFFSATIWKEDAFARASISAQIEQVRKKDPYYLTSKVLMMGSLFTEGEHFFLDMEHKQWEDAVLLFIEQLYKEQENFGASNVVLRDFTENTQLTKVFLERGFVKMDMPETCIIEDLSWSDEAGFMAQLSKRNKKHFKQEVRKYASCFDVEIVQKLSDEGLEHAFNLFLQVKNKNLALNGFTYPYKLFVEMNNDPNWEFIVLRLKESVAGHRLPVAVAFCHKNAKETYSGMFLGLDYEYNFEYGVYRQALYQCIRRSKSLGCKKVNLGVSATIEKKKLGATTYPRVAYVNTQDNLSMEIMEHTLLVTKH